MSTLLDMQVYALLERLHAEQHTACEGIIADARSAAQDLVAAARERARARVKAAVLEKRRRVEEHCRRVRTDLDAADRAAGFATRRAWLRDALEQLPQALQQRWQDGGHRQRWCAMVLDEAAAALDHARWEVAVAAGMPEAERKALAEHAARLCGDAVQVSEESTLSAGLVVRAQRSTCDGSVAGLMADRAWIESALLAEIERAGEVGA